MTEDYEDDGRAEPHGCDMCDVGIAGPNEDYCQSCWSRLTETRIPTVWVHENHWRWWLLLDWGETNVVWPHAIELAQLWHWDRFVTMSVDDFPGVHAFWIFGTDRSEFRQSEKEAFQHMTLKAFTTLPRAVCCPVGTVVTHDTLRRAFHRKTKTLSQSVDLSEFPVELAYPQLLRATGQWDVLKNALRTPSMILAHTPFPRELCELVSAYCWPTGAAAYDARRQEVDAKANEIDRVKQEFADRLKRLEREHAELTRLQCDIEDAFRCHLAADEAQQTNRNETIEMKTRFARSGSRYANRQPKQNSRRRRLPRAEAAAAATAVTTPLSVSDISTDSDDDSVDIVPPHRHKRQRIRF